MKSEEVGYLKLILGPMFSGKTSELIRIYRRYQCKYQLLCNKSYIR